LTPQLFDAVVALHAEVPRSARTAAILGTERVGAGIVIDADGLIVTIGYLVTEASLIEIRSGNGKPVPATLVGLDNDSGLALIRTAVPLGIKPMALGKAATLDVDQRVLVIGPGGPYSAQPATVVSRRVFAGYWEYLLEDAIFTAPPVAEWNGAALIGPDGKLLGVGSLIVSDAAPRVPGNMFVPVERLKASLADLLSLGRPGTPPHPWLGINAQEVGGHIVVTRVSAGGPAQQAGVERGDVIVAVAGHKVDDLIGFYRELWAQGAAGIEVHLTVRDDGRDRDVPVKTIDRYQYLKLDTTY
jgi:S1-C subfamily serine protease